MVKIIGTIYEGRGKYGDFEYMIEQDEYNNSLFIFNDNIEDHFTDRMGGGNAVIRPYNKYGELDIPKSAGIPTGSLDYGGFQELSPEVKFIIKSSIQEIKDLIVKYNYKTIYYSQDKNTKKIGTSIFNVNEDVINYIDNKINKL